MTPKDFYQSSFRTFFRILWGVVALIISLHELRELQSYFGEFINDYLSPVLGPYVSQVGAYIRSYVTVLTFQLLFGIGVLLAGMLLFLLRTARRRLYSILEIAFGVFASVYAANQLYDSPDQDSRLRAVFATVAGVYIIVRGLDNWQQSRPPTPPPELLETLPPE